MVCCKHIYELFETCNKLNTRCELHSVCARGVDGPETLQLPLAHGVCCAWFQAVCTEVSLQPRNELCDQVGDCVDVNMCVAEV